MDCLNYHSYVLLETRFKKRTCLCGFAKLLDGQTNNDVFLIYATDSLEFFSFSWLILE